MDQYAATGINQVSRLMAIPRINGPSVFNTEEDYYKGMFIGYSLGHSLPCFISFDLLMNPHIFIAGMTGSGKTYLMRNIMLRLSVILGYSVLLIDFTGEYKEFVEASGHVQIEHTSLEESALEKDGAILYVNLRGRSEEEKVSIARSILDGFVMYMRTRPILAKRTFLILDEAWKLLSNSESLAIVIREGRKYGAGLIMASQLVEDIELSVLGNVATLFMFRVQNKQSLDNIARNYNLGEELIESVQNLDVGSCLLVQLYKSNRRDAFVVRRVLGVRISKSIRIILGEYMDVEVSREAFEVMVRNLCRDNGVEVMSTLDESGSIELHMLIEGLIASGAKRHDTLIALRKLGVADAELADAFAVAIEEIGDYGKA